MTDLTNIVEILAKQALGGQQQSQGGLGGGLGGVLGSVLGGLGDSNNNHKVDWVAYLVQF